MCAANFPLGTSQLMAIEMGLLDAIVKQHGQSIDASTLAKQIQRDEVLIGQSIGRTASV